MEAKTEVRMKVILDGDTDLLGQLRAVRWQWNYMLAAKPGYIMGVRLAGGGTYTLKRNKNSIRVYCHKETDHV